jgi:hypothetical protein
MIKVDPLIERPTHHVKFTDQAGTSVGLVLVDSKSNANGLGIMRSPLQRNALKTSSGIDGLDDLARPWSPIPQKDWSLGRGQEDFEDNVSRFADSKRALTMFSNMVICGPQEVYTQGLHDSDELLPGSLKWVGLIGGSKHIANTFEASASYSATSIAVHVKRIGTPTTALTIAIYSDVGGEPGSLLKSDTVDTTDITDHLSRFWHIDVTAQALTSGSDYWVYVSSDGDDDNHWKVGTNDASGTTLESSAGSSWSAALYDLYYRVSTANNAAQRIKYFIYKQQLYCVVSTQGAEPTVWEAGDRGMADANTGALTTLVDATKSVTWVADEWIGCTVLLTAGTGSTEEKPYRTITDNTTTTLTVDTAWEIEHDTTTEYVILASNTWKAVASHGMTALVTDIMIHNNIAYFCQGDAVAIRRMQWAAGAYTWADDSTNTAYRLTTVTHDANGPEIWRANNGSPPSISKADVQDWGTDLTFAAAIEFKDRYGKITNIIEYGDTIRIWIMREGTAFYMDPDTTVPQELALKEIRSMMEPGNGNVVLTHNAYLHFNLINGLERYYNSVLDDIGPNREEGLPVGRQGPISSMVGYPGWIFASVDAGTSGYSSILVNNGGAQWHEIYRAPKAGLRIHNMIFQSLPGTRANRLHFQLGSDSCWLYMPSGPVNPTTDSEFRYTHETSIESSWMHAGMPDVVKFCHSVRLFTEYLAEDEQIIEVYYKIDEETNWEKIDSIYAISPVQEHRLVDVFGINCKRIKLMWVLSTTSNSITPKLKASVLESVSRVLIKYAFSMSYRAEDNDHDLNGDPEDMSARTKQDIIDGWAEKLTPLRMSCIMGLFDGKDVFIDAVPLNPNKEHSPAYIGKLVASEIGE